MQTIWISTGLFRGRPGDTDRGARVPPVLAEHVDEQITGRVGDARLLTELRRTGHEDQHLHDPDPVQIANRLRSDSERVERGLARQPAGRLEVDVPADDALAQQLAVLVGQLARDVDAGVHRPVVHVRRVATDAGKVQTEGLEPLDSRTALGVNLAHVSAVSLSVSSSAPIGRSRPKSTGSSAMSVILV